ncbi:ATP-binding protein [Arthrobacter sp. MYb214]|uniref:ATP-binding protein n=1 Tax=Arthrobacter sp. MYb214 TaxID=1848596 RepID=UPI00336A0438
MANSIWRKLLSHYRIIKPRDKDVDPESHSGSASFQLIAHRYEQGSVLVTSNMPFGRWGEVFGNDVVASAMLDRLVHHAEVLSLAGDSYRVKNRQDLLRNAEQV